MRIKSYLRGRSVVTAVEGHLSSPRYIKCGVLQGSVRAPIFYLLYFRSHSVVVHSSNHVIFAYDSFKVNTHCSVHHTTHGALAGYPFAYILGGVGHTDRGLQQKKSFPALFELLGNL